MSAVETDTAAAGLVLFGIRPDKTLTRLFLSDTGSAAGLIPGLALPQHCSAPELPGRLLSCNSKHWSLKVADTDLQYTSTPTRTRRPTAARAETTASGRTAVLPLSTSGPTLDWWLLLLTSEEEEETKSWTRVGCCFQKLYLQRGRSLWGQLTPSDEGENLPPLQQLCSLMLAKLTLTVGTGAANL